MVTDKLQTLRQTKVKMILKCVMKKTNIASGEVTTVEAEFHSKVEINLDGSNVKEMYAITVDKIRETMAVFQKLGSNWKFASIICLEVHTVKYEPLRGSSVSYTHLTLPTNREV